MSEKQMWYALYVCLDTCLDEQRIVNNNVAYIVMV